MNTFFNTLYSLSYVFVSLFAPGSLDGERDNPEEGGVRDASDRQIHAHSAEADVRPHHQVHMLLPHQEGTQLHKPPHMNFTFFAKLS